MFDFLVVGAGFSGCVISERLAKNGKNVLLVEKRKHIGGNAYDFYNEDGILIHKYGPHIFHTKMKHVWDYLSQFTEWRFYQHRVYSYVDGRYIPFPISIETLKELYGYDFTPREFEEYLVNQREDISEPRNFEEVLLSTIGRDLYEKFYENYTKKQWDLSPSVLDPSVTKRIPIRYNRDTRYFSDPYQGVPKYGYTKLFESLLNNERIHVMLNTDYKDVVNEVRYKFMIYTGPIDYFFDYEIGKLPYRSLQFEFETLEIEEFQPVGTVNYPNDYDFTRITEFKHITGQISPKTTIAYEYPTSDGDPYYPVPTKPAHLLYERYKGKADSIKDIYFVGRLAEYRYYNMDQVVDRALKVAKEILDRDR